MWDLNVFTKNRIWCNDNYVVVEGKWKNLAEDYFLINVYGPQQQPEKSILWDLLRSFIQNHQGNFILFGDLNEVRCETERFGSNFSSSDATIFNAFIQDGSLVELPMGLKTLQVTVLDRVWSDHNPILLHCQKNDFGPTPFKVYHSWFERCDFDNVEGVWISDPSAIKMAFLNFYKEKFSCHDSPVILPSMSSAKSLSDSDRHLLDSMVSLEEIINAVYDCGSQKAPGQDGFSFLFVKKYWDIMKIDIQNFVVRFFSSSSFPPGTNSSSFTLIPKVFNPFYIKEFRPISLIGFQYKIVAKILANRLSKVMDSIISQEQSAFISGRQILDGPLILSEVIEWYKKKKMLLFKVDFKKAFDSVSWRFFDHVMDRLGFSSTWRKWIMAGLKSSRASILVNGSPTLEFSLKRGLRQGDPLSPFLFIIVMEGFHIALKDGLTANLFQGVKIGSSEIRLSHLFYANDVIILSEWNQYDMDNIIRILNVFFLASGLKINISMSNLYGVEVSSNDIESMSACTGCSASNLPFSYLGFPIGSNMNRISNWNSLIDRFKNRLSGWKANMLSSGGRLTLIKSVLGSLGIYYFSIFKVPEAVLKLGGLGVGSLKAFNNSLLLKWRWRLLHNPSALWVEVLKSIHGNEAGIELKGCQTNGLWARIVGTIYHLHSSGYVPLYSLRYQVGDGSMIRFWKDTWLGDAPLCSRFNRLFHLEKNQNCLIRDRIVNGLWTWDWRRPVNGGRALADLNNLLMDIGSLNVEVDRDCVVSSLSTDGSYSVSFIRKHIDNCMIANSLPCTRWCTIIPRKVNIFMWRMLLDRLPHRLNLSSRGLDIDSILCPVCSEHVESNSHAFFSCSAASNIWRLVRGWCELKIPTLSSCDEWDLWFTSWKASKDEKDRAYVIFAATCWMLWRFRNNHIFNS
ncbi:RNA-directed DNA polymerase, eukaryota, reverse transcriptase zinc-binding domain protein [Tanacetum coccineum]